MMKAPKLRYFVIGAVLVVVIALSLIRDQPRAGKGGPLQNIVLYILGQRRTSKISRCKDNLRRIQLFKIEWADDEEKTTNDVPGWNDLRDYFLETWSNGIPICPAGGTYKFNRVREAPTCSIGGPGHSLP